MIKKYKEFINEGLLRHYNRWHKGEQRQQDKHEYVDLGLPSGLLWAKCNLGADTEVDVGGYYAWGETEEKDVYNWDNYKFIDDDSKIKKYNNKDNIYTLEPEDDAVYVNWGGKWRMPTEDECDELFDHTTSEWIKDYNETGVSGILFISKTNGNTLFFPENGFIGNNTINRNSKSSCQILTINGISNIHCKYMCFNFIATEIRYAYKAFGRGVRGVMKK